MTLYEPRKAFKPKRAPQRAAYDREVVHAILDEAYVTHVAFADGEGFPHVLPMYYVRDGESLLLHGSSKMGQAAAARRGAPFCAAVTLIDGLVLARSGFHHSVNYRSVVIHGQPEILEGEAKARALALTVERLAKGRAAETRAPNEKEMRATVVISLPLAEAAAKIRAGGVNDEPEDMDLPVWAGVIPMQTVFGTPEPDNGVGAALKPPILTQSNTPEVKA